MKEYTPEAAVVIDRELHDVLAGLVVTINDDYARLQQESVVET